MTSILCKLKKIQDFKTAIRYLLQHHQFFSMATLRWPGDSDT